MTNLRVCRACGACKDPLNLFLNPHPMLIYFREKGKEGARQGERNTDARTRSLGMCPNWKLNL